MAKAWFIGGHSKITCQVGTKYMQYNDRVGTMPAELRTQGIRYGNYKGARSSRNRPAKDVLLEPVEVQAVEGHLGVTNCYNLNLFVLHHNLFTLYILCINYA